MIQILSYIRIKTGTPNIHKASLFTIGMPVNTPAILVWFLKNLEVVYSQWANSIIFLKEKKGYMLLYSLPDTIFMKAQPESLLFGARVGGGVVEKVVTI
jgi:hypothetical protein